MGCTLSSHPECPMSEQAIRKAVLAAGKKAAVEGLCKRCNQIVGWFFLDRETFATTLGETWDSHTQTICDIGVDKHSSSCKLCAFLKAITPGNGKYVNDGTARLARSTVGAFFSFRSTRYNVPIFFVAPAERSSGVGFRSISAPATMGISTVFGFSNADPSRDGVAIRHLTADADLSLARDWIQMCDKLHTDCVPKGGIELSGFVLIDCEDERNILVDGEASMQFVTLSYVWGSEGSEGPDGSGRLPPVLPDLITGVIKVVLALGYRYLWIDRYCVPQTDSSGIKSLLLKSMDQIYSQSVLTIIAATTKCPSQGLAGITRPRIIEQNSVQLKSTRLLQWVDDVQSEIQGSVWNTRGWTYQEAVLSRRRLVFTEKQCYFQCGHGGGYARKEGSHMESIDFDVTTERGGSPRDGIPSIFPPRRQKVDHHHGTDVAGFQERVNEYAMRQLSSHSDVLPAFLGILGMLTAESPDFHGHIHGVPVFEPKHKYLDTDSVGTLITAITWHFHVDHENVDLDTATLPSRRRVLPSWTWCDWVNESPSLYPIKWEHRILSTKHPRRDMLLDTTISLEFEDGTVLPWPRGFNACNIAKRATSLGNVRFLNITGWFTNLAIPASSLNAAENYWQLWDYIDCGPYPILGSTLLWLQRLAKERGMRVTENKEYAMKAWVFAPVAPSEYAPADMPWDDAYMMILGETSTSAVFERIEVCSVIMAGNEMGNWKENDVEDIAEMFGWELKAFKLA